MNETTKTLSIVHVCSGDIWAGAECQALALCTALHQYGHQLTVITFNDGQLTKRLKTAGIPVIVINEKMHSPLAIIYKIFKLLKAGQPNILHCHDYKESVLTGVANWLSNRCPIVKTVHGGSEFKPNLLQPHKLLAHKLDQWISKYWLSTIVAVSSPLQQQLTNSYPHSHVCKIINGLDSQQIQQSAKLNNPVKMNSEKFNLAIIGRLIPLKRHDLILGALYKLKDSNSELFRHLHLYIVGDGPEQISIEKLINQYNLQQGTTLTGAIKDIYPLMANLDLLLMPSDHEGTPMTLLEAMTLGIPITAHAVGGIPDLLDNGLSGNLVSQHHPEGYSEAIEYAFNNPDQLSQRAAQAQQRIKKKFDITHTLNRYLQLYQQLAEQQ